MIRPGSPPARYSSGQSTAPAWVTAPRLAGPTRRAYFSSTPARRSVAARLPGGAAAGQLGVVELHVHGAGLGVDGDAVAVPQERDGAAVGGLRARIADHMPRVAPEKRPSVSSATFSPMPWP